MASGLFLLPVNYFQKKKPNYCFVRKLSYLWYMESGKDDEIKKAEPTKGELEILQVYYGSMAQTPYVL
jgi:hypothetical protein